MKLKNLKGAIFTGKDPTALTNEDGDELFAWLKERDQEDLIDPYPDAAVVGDELWVIVWFTV